jgi:hypothetical protein
LGILHFRSQCTHWVKSNVGEEHHSGS